TSSSQRVRDSNSTGAADSVPIDPLEQFFTLSRDRRDATVVIRGYQRRDSVPIISLVEALKAMLAVNELPESEYYQLLGRLRASKVFFLPLETGEILYHLRQANTTDRGLVESPELGVLRRYWAESLWRGRMIQRPDVCGFRGMAISVPK